MAGLCPSNWELEAFEGGLRGLAELGEVFLDPKAESSAEKNELDSFLERTTTVETEVVFPIASTEAGAEEDDRREEVD